MATIRAIMSRSPISIPASAIKNVRMSAFRGSFNSPTPLANILGVILSLAVACKILGAPNILQKAEERVAPQIPAITSSGMKEIFNSTFGSLTNKSVLTVYEK